ncbi:hypothetical protein QQF64_026655 [Cirrhinus molitorella]|uniref:Uncharacterized protein n=1 Tax=Cirrhinus molitorella TaxID=172907 RepID=A0ABR3NAJ2_9TELE
MLCLDVEHQAVTGSSVQCQIRLKLSILLCTKLCAFIHPAPRKTCLSISKPAVVGKPGPEVSICTLQSEVSKALEEKDLLLP